MRGIRSQIWMRMKMLVRFYTMLLSFVIALFGAMGFPKASRADILVYEGFNYSPTNNQSAGRVLGKNGGVGWGGAWAEGGGSSEAFVYDGRGNPPALYDGLANNGAPLWDGIITNVPSTVNYAGLSDWSSAVDNIQYPSAYRTLAQSADAMAGSNNVLWVSVVAHWPNTSSYGRPGIALTDGGYLIGRADDLSNAGSAIGVGNGNALGWPAGDLCPLIWEAGVENGTNGASLSATEDNLVVLKFEFGVTDTVYAYAFSESVVPDETTFTNNAVSLSGDIDETSLTTFCFNSSFPQNAIDEIRVGDSFDDVIGNIASGPMDADASAVSASPETVKANGVASSTMTVTLRDQFYLPITNKTVTLLGSTGNATITTINAITDADGDATFTVESTTVGTEAFTASNVTDSVGINQTASVLFFGGTDAGLSSASASRDTVLADGVSTATITVTLRDATSNLVVGSGVTLAGTGSSTITPSGVQVSDVNGQVTFAVSSSTVETEVFTATETNDSVVITQTVSVSFVNDDPSNPPMVYESFDYAVTNNEIAGRLDSKDGGIGFSGAWVDSSVAGGYAFVYDSAGNADTNLYGGTYGMGEPNWDGVIDNLPALGNWVGFSDWDNSLSTDRNLNSYRLMDQSAGAMAGADNILWVSFGYHKGDSAVTFNPAFLFSDVGSLEDRASSLSGNAIGIANGSIDKWPDGDICPIVYVDGYGDAENADELAAPGDYVVVLKFDFDVIDKISAWAFAESNTLSEATFEANAVNSTGSIDEDTLTTLVIGASGAANAMDEIRVANTFDVAVSWTGPPQGTMLIVR